MQKEKLENSLRKLLFDAHPGEVEGMDPRGQALYRRLIRASVFGAIRRAMPIARRIAGEQAIDELIETWLGHAPPQTHLYWQLPVEFGAWVLERCESETRKRTALDELIHWETVEIEVLMAQNAEPPNESDTSAIRMDPSARLCVYGSPVHRLDAGSTRMPEPSTMPHFVLAWRQNEKNEKNEKLIWRELHPIAAQLMSRATAGEGMEEALRALEAVYGTLNREQLHHDLADLEQAGALKQLQ